MEELKKEMFDKVIIFSIAEPGAMGAGGWMDFVTEDGEKFSLDYFSEKTLWESVKKCFPMLAECYFRGPAKRETMIPSELYDRGIKYTTVADGWKHIYLGYGNHLVVREDHFAGFSETISDLKTGIELDSKWEKRAQQYIQTIKK